MAIQFTFVKLFQSTLPRGERQHLLSVTKLIIYFNPRSHEGSDLHPTKNSGAGWIISIHAPTRGATVKNRFGLTDGKFQSTLPRGERRRKWKVFLVCIYFNPRSHEGSDLYALNLISIYMRISIHAPTRGATTSRFIGWRVRMISIHAPTRGATKVWFADPETIKISIHAPTRGATYLTLNSHK